MSQSLRIFGDGDPEWSAWNASQIRTYQPRHVPAGERERYSAETSLQQFYADCEAGRWEPVGRKKGRKKGTLAKERNAIRRWERFTRPDDWPGTRHWPGPSLQTIETVSAAFFDAVYDRMRTAYANATVKSTRSHLGVLIRHALTVKAIHSLPTSAPLERGDVKTRIYTPEEVGGLLKVLEAYPQPQYAVALWTGLHVGPRSLDLFCLRWDQIVKDALGRRLLDFESRKTSKLQAVPISDETWNRLDHLPRLDSYVFSGLSSPESDDPEKSYRARVRNATAKSLFSSVGVDVDKPWQVARATCNERYESHRPGVGKFILGHELGGVNARSYRQPTEAVHEAVRTLPPYVPVERQQRLF